MAPPFFFWCHEIIEFLLHGDLVSFAKAAGLIGIALVVFAESGLLVGFFDAFCAASVKKQEPKNRVRSSSILSAIADKSKLKREYTRYVSISKTRGKPLGLLMSFQRPNAQHLAQCKLWECFLRPQAQ